MIEICQFIDWCLHSDVFFCAHFLIKEVWNLYALEICLVNHIDWTCAAFEWGSKFNHFYDHSSDVFYFQYALKGQVRTSICWNCFDFVNCLTKEQTRLVKDRVAEVTSRTELENNEPSLKISQNVVQSIIWNGTSKPQPQFHRDVAVYPKRQSGIYQWGILGGFVSPATATEIYSLGFVTGTTIRRSLSQIWLFWDLCKKKSITISMEDSALVR